MLTLDISYYAAIQSTFPMLPYSKARLSSRLNSCPATMRDAFLESLYATVRSFPPLNAAHYPDPSSTRKAVSLISASQFENSGSRNLSTNIVLLQTMILLAIEADAHGPPANRTQSGPTQSVWLGSAVGLAYSMKLHMPTPIDTAPDSDMDSDEKVARRTWWSLVILDRYHASSTSSPVMIPDTSVVLLPDDQHVFGEDTYHLASKYLHYLQRCFIC
jgi:hypothetical protein